jgi:hypothetical protein
MNDLNLFQEQTEVKKESEVKDPLKAVTQHSN